VRDRQSGSRILMLFAGHGTLPHAAARSVTSAWTR
jgi:hypothetical protein